MVLPIPYLPPASIDNVTSSEKSLLQQMVTALQVSIQQKSDGALTIKQVIVSTVEQFRIQNLR